MPTPKDPRHTVIHAVRVPQGEVKAGRGLPITEQNIAMPVGKPPTNQTPAEPAQAAPIVPSNSTSDKSE